MSRLYFQCAARSAVGLVRNGNEDSALVGSQLIAIADGMGGHAGGEFASSVAIITLSEIAPTFVNSDVDSESASDLFLNSLHTIDLQIRAVTQDEPQLAGMGTTLTALFLNDTEISLLHVGDSRAYRLRGNELIQLSADHTVLQELLNKGKDAVAAVDALIDATYINGAPDNVTVILADLVESSNTDVEKLGAAKA